LTTKIKNKFFQLIDLFRFVTSWDDPSITPNTVRLFAKKVPVTASLENYIDAIINRFRRNGTSHIISPSSDSKRCSTSVGDYIQADSESINLLNKKLREPKKLVFYPLGLYECTMNDPDQLGCYNQSSLALLLELPPEQTVEHYHPITMWIAPAGTTDLDVSSFPDGRVTPDNLKGR
jgi:hypothetical protein